MCNSIGFSFGVNGAVANGGSTFKFNSNPKALNNNRDYEKGSFLSHKDIDDHLEKIMSYVRIVEKSTADMVPKAITFHIIEDVKNLMDKGLLRKSFDNFGTNIVSS